MSTPQSSRYPRPLRATHALGTGNASSNGSSSPSGRRFPTSSTSPSSPGVVSGRRAGLPVSPDSPGSGQNERILVPLSGRGDEEEEEEGEAENRRRANSLTSLADPGCCYGNSPWQRGTQLDLPLAPEGEGVGDETGTTEEPLFHFFSHKRSNSCSSADSLKKTVQVPAGSRREHVHTRKSIEGLNQEVSSVLEGILVISPHQHPDGHVAPTDLIRSGRPQSSPQCAIRFSPSSLPSSLPSSPFPHSTPSPSALATPDTPTGFPLLINSPSLSNPSFARDPPDGIERCLTAEIRPLSTEIIPIGPDKTKAKIVFQKSSAFLPTALAINSVS